MNDYTFYLVVILAVLGSCSAVEISHDIRRSNEAGMSPATACVKASWAHADRLECLKAAQP